MSLQNRRLISWVELFVGILILASIPNSARPAGITFFASRTIVPSLNVTGNVAVGGDLAVTGDETVGGVSGVTGDITAPGLVLTNRSEANGPAAGSYLLQQNSGVLQSRNSNGVRASLAATDLTASGSVKSSSGYYGTNTSEGAKFPRGWWTAAGYGVAIGASSSATIPSTNALRIAQSTWGANPPSNYVDIVGTNTAIGFRDSSGYTQTYQSNVYATVALRSPLITDLDTNVLATDVGAVFQLGAGTRITTLASSGGTTALSVAATGGVTVSVDLWCDTYKNKAGNTLMSTVGAVPILASGTLIDYLTWIEGTSPGQAAAGRANVWLDSTSNDLTAIFDSGGDVTIATHP